MHLQMDRRTQTLQIILQTGWWWRLKRSRRRLQVCSGTSSPGFKFSLVRLNTLACVRNDPSLNRDVQIIDFMHEAARQSSGSSSGIEKDCSIKHPFPLLISILHQLESTIHSFLLLIIHSFASETATVKFLPDIKDFLLTPQINDYVYSSSLSSLRRLSRSGPKPCAWW